MYVRGFSFAITLDPRLEPVNQKNQASTCQLGDTWITNLSGIVRASNIRKLDLNVMVFRVRDYFMLQGGLDVA